MFSAVLVTFCILPAMHEDCDFNFSIFSAAVIFCVCVCVCDVSHLNPDEVVFHCGFN